jgi:hypothetical protein
MTSELSDWKKSSYSGVEGDCVEVAMVPERVGVRDSKNRDGHVLEFPAERWVDFVAVLRRLS